MNDIKHGTEQAYRHEKCRCDFCKSAKVERVRQWRKKNPKKAAALATKQSNIALRCAAWMREHAPDVYAELKSQYEQERGLAK